MTEQELKKHRKAYEAQIHRNELREYKDEHGNVTIGRTDRNGTKIKMKLTFEEWLQIWIDSGHIESRGRGPGKFCMGRKNDLGHYEVGNVEILSWEENSRQAKLGRPVKQSTKAKMSAGRKGLAKSEDHKAAIALANRDRGSRIDGQCLHCGYRGNAQSLGRYHGDKCRHKLQFRLI